MGREKKIPDSKIHILSDIYEAGYEIQEIADVYGVSQPTIWTRLKLIGYKPKRKRGSITGDSNDVKEVSNHEQLMMEFQREGD